MATPTASPSLARPSPARTATLWAFRFVAVVQAIAFVLQPISIGSFLQGSWAAYDLHQAVGGLLVVWTAITGAVGLLLAILARHIWLGIGVAALCVLTTAQVAFGSTGTLSVHVPLGVALVVIAVWMSAWSWTSGVLRRDGGASKEGARWA